MPVLSCLLQRPDPNEHLTNHPANVKFHLETEIPMGLSNASSNKSESEIRKKRKMSLWSLCLSIGLHEIS